MQNPLPLEELTPEALGCGNAGGAPGTLADASQRRRTLRGLQL